MMNKTVFNGYLVRYSFAFNAVCLSIYIRKRKGQIVKINLDSCETLYYGITQYDSYARVDVKKSSLGYDYVENLIKDVMDNLEVTHYIDMGSDRMSYELSRALSC